MKVAVLGGGGRTGRLIVRILVEHGHEVRLLAHQRGTTTPGVHVVLGDARNRDTVLALVVGCDAVVSALGPTGKDRTLHRDVTPIVISAMRGLGVSRFVGISAAGVDLPGDLKSVRDRLISVLVRRLGGDAARDKIVEARLWRNSDLAWTLIRPLRLVDAAPSGVIEHDPHASPRSASIARADLAVFLVDVLENDLYQRQAPLVGSVTPRHLAPHPIPPRVSST
jgi:putative NADH-flavin reductase